MRKGLLELCILGIMEKEGEVYPSDILHQLKDARLVVLEGTLYPLLTRLKNYGLLDYEWKESTQGPPRKYFRLTAKGQKIYGQLKTSWTELSASIDRIIQTPKTTP